MWHMLRSGFAAIALLLFPPSAAGKPRSGRRTRRTGFPERVRKRHVAHLARCSHAAFPVSGRKRRKAVNTALSQGFAHGETQNTLRKAVEGPQGFRTWAGNVIDSSPPECLLSKGFRAGGKRPPLPGWRDGDSVEHVFGERDRDGAPYNIANQYEK